MIITWLGHSSFKIQDKTTAEGVTLITDPYADSIGFKMPRIEADVVTVSHGHEDHSNTAALRGDPYLIDCAGEYDVKGILVEGVEVDHDEKGEKGKVIAFRIDLDDITVVHLSDLGTTLSAKQLEPLAGTDILLIPVGGKDTLDAKKAVEVVSQIEPRIVIPMHYQVDGLKYDLDPVEKFIKELGIKPRMEEKLKVNKKDLPVDDMELVVLSM
jgi:L-ascorbate metabolism protein UlaG (beta-lactamase superfamily)